MKELKKAGRREPYLLRNVMTITIDEMARAVDGILRKNLAASVL